MKILNVISSTDPQGGGPIEVIKSTSEVWRRHGHTSHIASLDPPDSEWLTDGTRDIFALGLPRVATKLPGGSYSYSPKLAPWLKKHALDYDVAIVHGLWNYGSYGSWRGLHGSRTPYVVFTHGMLDPYFIEAYPAKARLKALFWAMFERKVLRDAMRVLFTTDEERDLAEHSFKPYHAHPLVVGLGARDVPHGEDHRVDFLNRAPSLRGRRFALFLGRIHPKKGIDLLIHAFAAQQEAVPDLDLLIGGPDQVGLQGELQAMAERLGVARRVHWPGMLTGSAKTGAFQQASFFALPSHQENFGIAIAEALAHGTPVLTTTKVNIHRHIAASVAGVVVADDVAGVSDGFHRMALLTDVERATMAAQARACFLEHFELDRVALTMLAEIAQACRLRAGHLV